jgi:predicted transcriptional regulator
MGKKENILNLLKDNSPMTFKDICNNIVGEPEHILNDLNILVRQGKLSREGRGENQNNTVFSYIE